MRLACGLYLLCLLGAGSAAAEERLWLGAGAGTLGLGVEAGWRVLPWLDLRAGYNAYDYDDRGSRAGINYDASARLQTLHATANFRRPSSRFRLTAGVYGNRNRLRLLSSETGTLTIGSNTYAAADVGRLRGTADFRDVAPYAGIGFDFGLAGRLGLSLDLGVLVQGGPRVDLAADGPVAEQPSFAAALEEERRELEDDLDDLKLWPVASLAFRYAFR